MHVRITIDDVSPHPRSSVKVLDSCNYVLERFPAAKFVLFVPASYWRTCGDTRTEKPLNISEYPQFCEILATLPDNFQLGFHGYYHGIKDISNNDEFMTLSFEEADIIVKNMINEVKKSGLFDRFTKVFRPPAWKMSRGSIEALYANGITHLALSPSYHYDYEFGEEGTKFCKENTFSFYNICPPFCPFCVHKGDYADIVYHACEWDYNYFNKIKAHELISFLNSQEELIFEGY